MSCSLAFMFDTFIPIIKACQKKSLESTVEAQKGYYCHCIRKSWELITASFLTATDLVTVLPNYKKMVIRTLNNLEDRESGLVITKGIVNLIRFTRMCLNEDEEDSNMIESDEEPLEKGKDTQWDEIDGMRFKTMHRSEWSGPLRDPSTASAVLELLKSMAEVVLQATQRLYDSFHGEYGDELPKFSGIGKKGDVNTVALLRDHLEDICSVASSEVITRYYTQLIQQLDSVLKEEESIERTRQQILLGGALSAVIPFLKDSGKH